MKWKVNENLCQCENLGWDGIKFCPVHPECTDKGIGCLKYSDPWKPAHSDEQKWYWEVKNDSGPTE